MPATMGVLGENTAVAQATVTVYTVPANRAARIRILFAGEVGASGGAYKVMVGMPGLESTWSQGIAAGVDVFSGIALALPVVSRDIGLQATTLGGSLVSIGTDKVAVVPWPHDFILSAGDTVRYIIQDFDLLDHIFQVIGVEDDV